MSYQASVDNPLGLQGIAFVEFATPSPWEMTDVFLDFGFSHTHAHHTKAIDYYGQHDLHFFLTREEGSFAAEFASLHGPSICSLGLRFLDPWSAWEEAVRRGATPYEDDALKSFDAPAVYGIGDSLLYFVEADRERYYNWFCDAFAPVMRPEFRDSKGFLAIDHLTHNVPRGGLDVWARFYKDIFGFTEVRTFDIRGEKTGLQSYALRSPDGSFCIPINEGTEEASQIEEYLREYKGAGIQHLAFLTDNLLGSLQLLEDTGITTLDIHPEYYIEAFQRVPQVTESHEHIKRHQVLVDGDEKGYLLQIFTTNLFGPIFIELIQRKNHNSFGEGNFQALFTSIEREQMRRGAVS